MLFSGDTLAPGARRRSLAVEPMTCAPNALQSGDGLRTLEPRETFAGAWGIRASVARRAQLTNRPSRTQSAADESPVARTERNRRSP